MWERRHPGSKVQSPGVCAKWRKDSTDQSCSQQAIHIHRTYLKPDYTMETTNLRTTNKLVLQAEYAILSQPNPTRITPPSPKILHGRHLPHLQRSHPLQLLTSTSLPKSHRTPSSPLAYKAAPMSPRIYPPSTCTPASTMHGVAQSACSPAPRIGAIIASYERMVAKRAAAPRHPVHIRCVDHFLPRPNRLSAHVSGIAPEWDGVQARCTGCSGWTIRT